jgi:predicted glycosyltransferase
MRYLVFTNTPAHVHLYKNAVAELQRRGHEVRVLARDYGCTLALADAADLPYRVYGGCETTKRSLLKNLPRQYARALTEAVRFDPDVVFGIGAYAAPAGRLTGARTLLVHDSEPSSLDHRIARSLADALLTPDTFRDDLGPKHRVFHGFKESAYLHPDRFSADPTVREDLGVGDDPFVICRLNAFGSHHDVGHGGFTAEQVRTLIADLAEHATVLVSDEGDELDVASTAGRRFDLHPARLHDALAAASLLVADTQTMVTEAALLGTPAVRSNSFVGEDDMGNFVELEERGLVCNVESFERVRSTALDLLDDDGATDRWESRRRELLDETVDLTELLVSVAETPNEIDGVSGVSQRVSAPTPGTGRSSTAD